MVHTPDKKIASINMLGLFTSLAILVVSLFGFFPLDKSQTGAQPACASALSENSSDTQTYLPLVSSPGSLLPSINVPFFEGLVAQYHESAILWFGQVRGNENYADVRVGYHSEKIFVRVSVFDNHLWYDDNPVPENLDLWDAITLYLDVDGRTGRALDAKTYRFVGQLVVWGDRDQYQAAYQGSSSGWNQVPLAFGTSSGWKGNSGPNNNETEDRGYVLTFHIPYSSLGLAGPPEDGEKWGIALTLHDRDDAAGSTLTHTNWPQDFNPSRSVTWGQLSFGLPKYSPPDVPAAQTVTIRNGLNGISVEDGVVGGNTLCGEGLDFWNEWGDYSYHGTSDMNVQNQGNIDDWPCFSKFYITFPLNSLPKDKMVISATLTLHQSGQSTGFDDDPPEALNSLVQIMEVAQDWDKATLTWNNAPLVIENISQAWVGPITMEEWGKPTTWDVSQAVAKAHTANQPLHLVFYSADHYGPNGKYFLSSTSSEWDMTLRPTLEVTLGDQ